MAVSPACISAIEAALKRKLTNAEKTGLTDMRRDVARGLTLQDPAAWQATAQLDRDILVAKAMGQRIVDDALRKRANVAKSVLATKQLDDYIADYLQRFPGHTAWDATKRLLAILHDNRAGLQSVATKAQSIAAQSLRGLITDMTAYGPKLWGLVRNKEGREALVKEAHSLGSSGDPVARSIIERWTAIDDALVARLNAAGGHLVKLGRTYLPTDHEVYKVAAAVRQKRDVLGVKSNKWVEDNHERFDRGQFVNEDGSLMDDAKYITELTEMSRTIQSTGYSKIDPSKAAHPGIGGGVDHTKHRRLPFASADAEIAYKEQYANPNVVAGMVSHVWAMAREIAALEQLGPNLEGQRQHLRNIIKRDLADRVVEGPQVDGVLRRFDRLYEEVVSGPQTITNRLARNASEIRALVASVRLGKIAINSLPDQGVLRVIASLNHLDQLELTAAQLNALTSSDYINVLHAYGFGLDNLISQLNRMGEQNFGYGIGSRMANFLIGSTGHMRIERAGRAAFEAMAAKMVTDVVPKYERMADMPDASHHILKMSGMTEPTWAVLRETTPTDVGGMPIITVDGIAAVDPKALARIGKEFGIKPDTLLRDAQDQLIGYQLDQSHRAIVTPGAHELAMLRGQSGTWQGEIWNSVMLFKSFPFTQMAQMYHSASGISGAGKIGYVAAHVAATTVLGYVALQVGELINGRDPRSQDLTGIEGWRTLMSAMLKGGSLGFYGDFLYAPMNRYNTSLFAGLAGPVAATIEQGLNITQGAMTKALIKMINGEEIDVNWTEDMIRFGKGNIPVLGSHFAVKPLLDHLIWHNLQEWASPGYIRRMKYRAQREYQQGYFVEPGDMLPSRAPDFGKLLPWRAE